MRPPDKKYRLSFYEAAPQLLLTKTAEMQGILVKHKHSGKSSPESRAFYEDLIQIMQHSYRHMDNTKYIHEQNAMLRSQNSHLVYLIQILEDRLKEYEVIERLEIEGRMSSVQDTVNKIYKEKLNKIKENGSN